MRIHRVLIALTLVGFAMAAGCGGSGDSGTSNKDGSVGAGADAGSNGGNAGTGTGGGATGGSGTGGSATGGSGTGGSGTGGTGTGGSGTGGTGTGGTGTGGTGTGGTGTGGTGTGGSGGCHQVTCQGHLYRCGDCIDNDGDGKTDMDDPDCLGPCDNNETGYDGCVSGQNNAPCKADCYFDQDTGSGNDDCYWDHRCDPLEVKPNYPPEGSSCAYDPSFKITGTSSGSQTCTQAYNTQSATCNSFCGKLTPNGCDCFGCCELPAGSGKYVYLGSTSDNSGKCVKATCDLAHVNDPSLCKPCTPVKGCFNDCKHCELCLGKTKLPSDCLPPPPPDGGTGGSSTGGTGGTTGTGGTGTGGTGTGGSSTGGSGGTGGSTCGGQICPGSEQPCGLSCQPPCPNGQFCLTGCCIPFA